MTQFSNTDSMAERACPKWTWCLMAVWLGLSAIAIVDWQIEDVIAGTVCTNPASAQWELFK